MLFNIINTLNVLLYSSGCKKIVKATLFMMYSNERTLLMLGCTNVH